MQVPVLPLNRERAVDVLVEVVRRRGGIAGRVPVDRARDALVVDVLAGAQSLDRRRELEEVYFSPGGPLIARSFAAIALPLFDFAAIAPRMHVIAASNSFTSSDWRCAFPGNAAYSASNRS